MKKLCLTTAIAVLWMIFYNGVQAQIKPSQPNQVVIGLIDTIYSKILNEQRRILINVPSSAISQDYNKLRYPVIYLLDGDDSHFSAVVGKVQQLSSGYVCPEMIVVGIPNTDRTRDLTPTHMDSFQFLDFSINTNTSGAGEKFISFIEKELIPYIDSLYPASPYRMIIGHSFGGLTVMNTFIHHTNLFKAYVAIDPAMSWDNQKLLKEAKTVLATKSYLGISLFLGIANNMKIGMDTIKVKKDATISTEHIRSLFELRNFLNINKQNKLKYTYKYYYNDNHVSIPLIAEYDALRFIFDYYYYNIFGVDCKNIQNHFDNVSKQIGYHVKPPERMINTLAYLYLRSKRFDEALYLFKLNVINYPESRNVFDSIGEFYEAKGDTVNAIDSYIKSLSIKESPYTRRKLEKLQGK